jgi:type II secretory pathway component PulF
MVVNIWEKSQHHCDHFKSSISIGSGVKQADVMRMTKNLSAMLTAGLSLSRGLS